jgi:drug/metabolite transporter (DMT)-like permease
LNSPLSLPVPANILRGVLLVLGATLAFAITDTIGKHLYDRYPVAFVQAVRYTINVVFLAAVFLPRHGPALWRTHRTGLVILRGFALALASLTMGLALRLMPLPETISILYLSPFAVMLVAIPLLGEKVTPLGWLGAITGFAGVLLIVRPGGGLDPVGVGFALMNAALSTIYLLMTRVLTRTETTHALVFFTALIGAAVFGVLTLVPWFAGTAQPIDPSLTDWSLLVLLGVAATVGHLLLTEAYRQAPASALAPINYMHLAWAGVLGWLVFAHVPDAPSLVGMALITTAGVGVALHARRRQRIPVG